MDTLLNGLILLAVIAVSITLGFGLYSLFRGGAYALTHSNRLMRMRVLFQAIAVLLLAIGLLFRAGQGG